MATRSEALIMLSQPGEIQRENIPTLLQLVEFTLAPLAVLQHDTLDMSACKLTACICNTIAKLSFDIGEASLSGALSMAAHAPCVIRTTIEIIVGLTIQVHRRWRRWQQQNCASRGAAAAVGRFVQGCRPRSGRCRSSCQHRGEASGCKVRTGYTMQFCEHLTILVATMVD